MMRGLPRPIRVEGDIAYVPLTRGKVAIIDAADVPLVEGRNWFAVPGGKTFYGVSMLPRSGGRQRSISLHVTILPGFEEVDHRDGDGLNCRRSNLRPATRYKNIVNRGLFSNNTSGHTGVSFHKATGKWQAEIKAGKKAIYLGVYANFEDALSARLKAEEQYHGEFSRRSSR